MILNALTIVAEFIGVSLALGFLGCPKTISSSAAAVLLFVVVAGGSFRRCGQLMFKDIFSVTTRRAEFSRAGEGGANSANH